MKAIFGFVLLNSMKVVGVLLTFSGWGVEIWNTLKCERQSHTRVSHVLCVLHCSDNCKCKIPLFYIPDAKYFCSVLICTRFSGLQVECKSKRSYFLFLEICQKFVTISENPSPTHMAMSACIFSVAFIWFREQTIYDFILSSSAACPGF